MKTKSQQLTKEIQSLTSALERRKNCIQDMVYIANPDDSYLLECLHNLRIDIDLAIESANNYLKIIEHAPHDTLDDKAKIIAQTKKYALLITDKRLIDLVVMHNNTEEIADAYNPIYSELEFASFNQFKDSVEQAMDFEAGSSSPIHPHFSQIQASDHFKPTVNVHTSSNDILGKSVASVADQIREGTLSSQAIRVSVFYHQGEWIAENNRSLAAASLSQTMPRFQVIFPVQFFINLYEEKKTHISKPAPRSPKGRSNAAASQQPEATLFSIVLADEQDKSRKQKTQLVTVPDTWVPAIPPSLASASASAAENSASPARTRAEPSSSEVVVGVVQTAENPSPRTMGEGSSGIISITDTGIEENEKRSYSAASASADATQSFTTAMLQEPRRFRRTRSASPSALLGEMGLFSHSFGTRPKPNSEHAQQITALATSTKNKPRASHSAATSPVRA